MRQRKHDRIITGAAANRLLWFTVGQALQLVLHALFINWWDSYQIPLCAAAGFVVLLFFFAGSWTAAKDDGGNHWEDLQ